MRAYPVVREILHIRNSTLYVPRDFDISPYFKIVVTIEQGLTIVSWHGCEWKRAIDALV